MKGSAHEWLGPYRKVYVRLWRHSAFLGLTDREQLVTFYALTGPQTNRLGYTHFSTSAAAEDLRLRPAAFHRAFATVCAAFGWKFDARNRVLWISSWWRFNPPENLNVLKGCLNDLADVPDSPLLVEFAHQRETLPETFRQTFEERMGERIGKPSPNQGTGNREQETGNREHVQTLAPLASANGHGRVSVAELRKGFERFWVVYPKKVGKDAAWLAWKKRRPSAELTQQICAALAWQAKQDNWLSDGGRYVPHPTTWIRRGQWTDEPSTTPRLNARTHAIAHAAEEFLK